MKKKHEALLRLLGVHVSVYRPSQELSDHWRVKIQTVERATTKQKKDRYPLQMEVWCSQSNRHYS